ncbi:MAG: phosphatase domain-containing protein [Bacteroidota bacterium]
MSSLRRLAHTAEQRLDGLKSALGRRFGRPGEPIIVPYFGFGTRERVQLSGRVLTNPSRFDPGEGESMWQNVLNMYRRFETDEVAGAHVRVEGNGQPQIVQSDEEGYFTCEVTNPHLKNGGPWYNIDVYHDALEGTRVNARVLVPSAEAEFGIISDVDDTVMQSNATSLLSMVRTTLLNNARTRLPFEGVAAFYRALTRQTAAGPVNPIFYVSSSPWNVYDLLVDFMSFQGIPLGPFFLRDWGVDEHKLVTSTHADHKLTAIFRVLDTYPDLPFVLIGDSGQHDPEIYQQVAQARPGRIRAIYIRDVTLDDRDAAVRSVASEVEAGGVPMLLTPTSHAAAEHAALLGLIDPETVAGIRSEIDHRGDDE